MQKIIKNNAFNLVERLKKIDKSFYIVFNSKNECFEVHSNKQKNSFCFKVPYSQLDARTLHYAKKTSVKNLTEILQEIEKFNSQQELNSKKEKEDYIKQRGYEIMFFLQNSTKDANFSSVFAKKESLWNLTQKMH